MTSVARNDFMLRLIAVRNAATGRPPTAAAPLQTPETNPRLTKVAGPVLPRYCQPLASNRLSNKISNDSNNRMMSAGNTTRAYTPSAKWVPVLIARDRSAGEADFILKHFTLKNDDQHLLPLLSRDIVLCTDGHLTFEVFTDKHQALSSSAGERMKASAFHLQGVNSYHQRSRDRPNVFTVSPPNIGLIISVGSDGLIRTDRK